MTIKNGYPGAGSINILLIPLELLYSINSIVFLKTEITDVVWGNSIKCGGECSDNRYAQTNAPLGSKSIKVETSTH